MFNAAIIGLMSGVLVLVIEYIILEKIYKNKPKFGTSKIRRDIRGEKNKAISKGEIEVDGTIEEVKKKIDRSLRFLYLSPRVHNVDKTSDTISFSISSLNFPEEISYKVSRGWSKPVKVTYEIDFSKQKRKFRKISYVLLFGIAAPIATAIPWLVTYVVTHYSHQKVQLIQLLHMWHIWWPFFPFIIYRKTKRMSRDFFENILRL
jgi:hypothetical protein